jgi:signal peptidase II
MEHKPFFSRPVVAVVFIVAALLIDQVIKYMVETGILQDQHVFWYLYLYRAANTGVAFSMLSEMPVWAILTMRMAIVAFIIWWWRTGEHHGEVVNLGFCLVIAGALGNIVDRLIYDHVVDYILFQTETWAFAIFNMADSLITVGAVLIGFSEIFLNRSAKK